MLTRITTLILVVLSSGTALAREIPNDWPSQMEQRCENAWPAAETTTRFEAELCARYWLKRYVYGNQQIESIGTGPNIPKRWFQDGHYNGLIVETKLTSTQIRAMLRHINAALLDTGTQGQVRRRATEYLSGALRSRFTLDGLSGVPIDSIVPQLTKVLRGERLTPEDLYCRTQVTLWKLEGAVIARHGGALGHPDLHTFFYGKRTRELKGLQRTSILPRKPADTFHTDQLDQVDKDNLDLLAQVGDLDQQSRCRPIQSWDVAARY